MFDETGCKELRISREETQNSYAENWGILEKNAHSKANEDEKRTKNAPDIVSNKWPALCFWFESVRLGFLSLAQHSENWSSGSSDTSHMMSATTCCFLEEQESRLLLRKMREPEVLLLLSISVAQSTSQWEICQSDWTFGNASHERWWNSSI